MKENYLWGIDLGGTKVEGIVCNKHDLLSPLARERIPTESGKGYDHIISRIYDLVEILKSRTGLAPDKIGFGTPGILDPDSLKMKNCNSTALNGNNLKADLEQHLKITVSLANDANCFALSEAIYGAAKGAKSVFGVILGTGVGGGIVIDGKILSGFHGIAGEWGHNVLIENGRQCYCGKKGCVETVISGPALEEYYTSISGKKLKLHEIFKTPDDSYSIQTLEYFTENFSKAISVVLNILDPEIVVLGGGVSNIDAFYSSLPQSVIKYIFNDKIQTKFLKNTLGDSAGVYGAALLN